MEGVRNGRLEEDEVEKGGCTRSQCVEEWHFGKPSNPCKRGNTDVKTMMMMMMMMSAVMCDVSSSVVTKGFCVRRAETVIETHSYLGTLIGT